MTKDTIADTQAQTESREFLLCKFGFAWRHRHGQSRRSWRETVTHFKPEPWLAAMAHEKARTKVRIRDLPAANK
jgi:hypothetical protein